MKIAYYFLFFLVCVTNYKLQSQSPAKRETQVVDSLKNILSVAKSDTQKINLQFKIAELSSVFRIGFWDSLRVEAKKNNMQTKVCQILNNLGYINMYILRNREKGAVYLEECIGLCEQIDDKSDMLVALINISPYYFKKNEIKKAIDSYYKGLKASEDLRDKGAMFDMYTGLGLCYFSLQQYDKSLEMHLKSLEIGKELKDNRSKAYPLVLIGADYFKLKNNEKAVYYYLQCKKFQDVFGTNMLSFNIYNSIAAGYNLTKQFDSAYKYASKALQMAKTLGNNQAVVSSMHTMAGIKYEEGDNATAKKITLEVFKLLKTMNFPLETPEVALLLKNIHLKDGNYKDALEAYEIHTNAKDSLAKEDIRKKALEKEFDYSLEKKESENKLLAQQNQIQSLQLTQNRYFMLGFSAMLLLIIIIAYLLMRQNKLRAEQQSMLLEQKLISSQMNPHFVFNSLNSIQQLIMSRENEKAELYLSKFAKLVRELLESNTKESLSISDEVSILNGYVEMELRRFGRAFGYSVYIDEKINAEKFNIPHMMIQPFVENAIWHGLLNKEGVGNLVLEFRYDTNNTIKCIIDDNGVGRAASKKKTNTFKKRSLALSFVKQRAELMRETLKINCSVNVIDKLDERGESLGTRVELILPLIEKQRLL